MAIAPRYRVFVAYTRQDADLARRYAELLDGAGFEAVMDDGITPSSASDWGTSD